MRIDCDEGVPRGLGRSLRELGLDVTPAPRARFDVPLSNDKNLVIQLNPAALRFAIVTLPTNQRPVLIPGAADIAETLQHASPGRCIAIGLDGRRTVHRLGESASDPEGVAAARAIRPLSAHAGFAVARIETPR